MNKISHNSEKGQAIVFLVIGLVVFLGFVAMAIDGGMALADRRHEQNAADAASLAGGGKVAIDLENSYVTKKNWNCGNYGWVKNNAEVAASTRAAANGFPITYNLNNDITDDTNYALATCENKYIDVTVDIFATTPSNFLQLVFPEALSNEVEAVTRVYPRHPISPGNAIIALNSAECNGNQNGDVFWVNPQDDTTLTVNNGSIHSNGCLKCNGQPNIVVSCLAGSDCNPAGLGSFGNDPETCNGTWTPPPESPVEQIDPTDFSLITPNCSAPGAHNYTGGDFEKLLKPNKLYTMASGLWCINGNVTINSNYELAGDNVTIYIINGDFTVNGTAQINLSASTDTHASPEIPGVLIYLPPPDPFNTSLCTNHTVKLDGTSTSTLFGSIIAPCSRVTLTGTGGNTYMGQIVGWNVDVGGDAALNLTYNENLAASDPTKMELHR